MKRKIAIIEDNPDNRLLVRALLEDDYQLTEFDSGPPALTAFRTDRPDLVLLDISLPGMDGTEVLDQLRADPALRHLPVIALTAHAMTGDRVHFLTIGFDDYVTKPILDEKELLTAITRLLEKGLLP